MTVCVRIWAAQPSRAFPESSTLPQTAAQVAKICASVLEHSERVIVSGPNCEQESLLRDTLRETLPDVPLRSAGRALVVGPGETAPTGGRVVAIGAGTSDLPVLEEAVAVARELGVAVESFHDVGVAGIHRLAAPLEEMHAFDPDCVVVAAGMEGALPSVISALVAVPVVGLPTSTGYGLGGDGTAASSVCYRGSPGLSVLNVERCFAGLAAASYQPRRPCSRTPQ